MKILQVTNFFKPYWEEGGVVRVSYEISRGLSSNNHKVTVFTCNKLINRLKYKANIPIIEENIKIYYFDNFLHFISLRTFPLPFLSVFTIKKEVKKFDIVHIHEHRTLLAIFVSYYARKYNIPYVIHGHGSVQTGAFRKRVKKIFDIFFGYRIIKNAAILIAVSKEEANHYHQIGGKIENIVVLYNGLNIDNFKNLPKKGIFKKKYGITNKMILFLGRIEKIKGLFFAIKAFLEVVNDLDNVTFVIAGPDYGYKSELENFVNSRDAKDKVKFIGYVDEIDKIHAYVDSDLFVHTVINMGGVGLAPLEAILCGSPVVVTPGCGEIIIQNNCGYVVQYGDIEGLKKVMRNVLTNPKDDKMITRGIVCIHENYTWDKYTDSLEKLYQRIVIKKDPSLEIE